MEQEIAELVQQANVVNLNYTVAKTSNDELDKIDQMLSQLQSRVGQLRANLLEESNLLETTAFAIAQVLAKVKGKPMPSSIKGAKSQPGGFSTPSKATTPGKKAVSFDIRSSPLSLCQSVPETPLMGVNTSIAKLALAEFDAIPKYMKGRLTVDKLNAMVDLLNALYAEKYAIMNQNPNKLPHEFRQKYWDWKEANCEEVQERYFITEADIKNAMQSSAAKQSPNSVFKLDPIGRSVLAILRHFGRIREIRTPGVVRFVIL